MPSGFGTNLILAANLVLLVAGLAGFVYLYLMSRTTDESAPEEWYKETVSLTREVKRVAATDEGFVDRDRVQREMIPLATRLKSHARSAPEGVNAIHAQTLHELGVDCYQVGMEHTEQLAVRADVFIEERLEELERAAEELEEDASAGL